MKNQPQVAKKAVETARARSSASRRGIRQLHAQQAKPSAKGAASTNALTLASTASPQRMPTAANRPTACSSARD